MRKNGRAPVTCTCCSAAQLYPTLCDPVDCSMPGFSLSLSPGACSNSSIESVMPSNHLILCPLLLLPSVFPSIRVFIKIETIRVFTPLHEPFTKKSKQNRKDPPMWFSWRFYNCKKKKKKERKEKDPIWPSSQETRITTFTNVHKMMQVLLFTQGRDQSRKELKILCLIS